MARSVGRPVAVIGALTVVVAGFVPTVATVAVDGWLPNAGFLLLQAMVTAAGLLLLWSRDSRRHAVLLLTAGVLVGVSNLENGWSQTTATYLTQIGWTFQWSAAPLVAAVLLSYPGDRVSPRSCRVLVALLWVWAVGIRLVGSLLWDPREAGYRGPTRWVTAYEANDVARAVEAGGTYLLAVLVVWFVTTQTRRWRGARGASRTPVRLMAAAGVVLATGLLLRQSWGYAVTAGWVDARAEPWLAGAHAASGALVAAALVAVALRAATRRAAVVERVLAAGDDGRSVQEVLRGTLADPSLRLRFAVGSGWVDVDGRPAPDPGPGRVTQALLRQDGVTVVELDAEDHVLLDAALLRVTLSTASMVLHNTRLTIERTAHLAEVSASRARIVEAGIAQRRRLERDLHDGAQQSLLAVSATLSRALMTQGADEMRAVVDEARSELTGALGEVRRLARGIHPAALSQGGLTAGLRSLAAGSHVVDLRIDEAMVGGRRYSSAVESTAYYVVAEALANAVKHAGAGHVEVSVAGGDHDVAVTVTDRGPGGAHAEPGGGLAGLGDRVHALGGVLRIDSAVGQGTTVSAWLPDAADV